MKKRLILAPLVVGAAAFAYAQGNEFITIGSGSTTGVYFPVATGFAKLINDANLGLRANARSTGGSVFNVNALKTGELQMAIAQNDIVYYAFTGTGLEAFKNKPNKELRTVASLYPELVHVVARQDAKISSIADLKGKRVVVGDIGSGTEQNAAQILEAYGLDFDDLGQTIRTGATQGIQLLQDKRADVLFYTTGLGASAIQQAALTTPINLVPVTGKNAADLIKKYPFYVNYEVPGKSYQGVNATVPTVAVQATLVTTSDVSPEIVYKATKAILGEQGPFKGIHPNLANNFNYTKAVAGLPAPLHPGAEKFYKEQGVLK